MRVGLILVYLKFAMNKCYITPHIPVPVSLQLYKPPLVVYARALHTVACSFHLPSNTLIRTFSICLLFSSLPAVT
ncbi:hypothetical protein L1987_14879 [Smallanthus sonchifolius]|uniref:Uncharacterized protein n=1 Tax=Smallanthus sonchifolius TaxID=185202 RepID=A0ACB9J4J7_9ASTR|nr:hypothetical protein L1987_14879 [Smallanthus sonchifolius]